MAHVRFESSGQFFNLKLYFFYIFLMRKGGGIDFHPPVLYIILAFCMRTFETFSPFFIPEKARWLISHK